MSLAGIQVAVVTGGGHGIGRALSRRLARDGVKVVVADIDGDAASTVATEIDGVAKQLDVSDEQAMLALVESVESEVGAIDLFISNAGVGFGDGPGGAISSEGGINASADRWSACWEVHRFCSRSIPGLFKAPGKW